MRYDERDTVFSRLRLLKGSNEYNDYYLNNTDKKEVDDRLREGMKTRGSTKKSSEPNEKYTSSKMNLLKKLKLDESDHGYGIFKMMDEQSKRSNDMVNEANNMKVDNQKKEFTKEEASNLVKEFVRINGLSQVGIAKLSNEDLYTKRGYTTKEDRYGDKVSLNYKYAIVFAAPIEKEYINKAPGREVFIGAMLSYSKSSEVAARLSMYIKSLGHDSITDSKIKYHSPISFLGEKAGLGEMGRCNAVVNPKYGNRTKFAAVYTNLPLIEDGVKEFGLKEFCESCRMCMNNCPKKAISNDPSYTKEGKKYWEHNSEKCMEMWISTGHTCGICMSSCPFSQGIDERLTLNIKENPNIIKKIIREHVEKYGKRNYNKNKLKFMP